MLSCVCSMLFVSFCFKDTKNTEKHNIPVFTRDFCVWPKVQKSFFVSICFQCKTPSGPVVVAQYKVVGTLRLPLPHLFPQFRPQRWRCPQYLYSSITDTHTDRSPQRTHCRLTPTDGLQMEHGGLRSDCERVKHDPSEFTEDERSPNIPVTMSVTNTA